MAPAALLLSLLLAAAACDAALLGRRAPKVEPAAAALQQIAASASSRGREQPSASNRAYERATRQARAAAQQESRVRDKWTAATDREAATPAGAPLGGRAASPPAALPAPPLAPELASSGVSGALGFCSGRFLHVAGDAAALSLGAAFVVVSLLSRAGYVTIHYTKVERDLLSLLDLNQDGRVDEADYVFASKRAVSLLGEHGVSSTAGFAAGFALGFLKG